MPSPKSKLPRDVPRTMDLRLSANLFQTLSLLVLSFVGAIVGYQAVAVGRWYVAAAGAVVGMVIGTFISGFILMLLPQTIPTIAADAWLKKFRSIRRRWQLAAFLSVAWAHAAIAWCFLALPTPGWLIAAWSVLMLVGCGLSRYYGHVLELFRCPDCDTLFGLRGIFDKYPHCCRHCGFTVDREWSRKKTR